MEIVPAIDIIDGKCVRLSKGDFNTSKIYGDNPLEMAKMFADAGLKRLHLVDLDGARSRHIVNTRTLESIAGNALSVLLNALSLSRISASHAELSPEKRAGSRREVI